MEVDFEVFDIESIEKRIETLKINLYSFKNYGDKLIDSDNVIKVYELTIKYLTELIKKVHLIDKYSKAYSEKLNDIISLDKYKAGDNLFIDQCIKSVSQAENIINQSI